MKERYSGWEGVMETWSPARGQGESNRVPAYRDEWLPEPAEDLTDRIREAPRPSWGWTNDNRPRPGQARRVGAVRSLWGRKVY